MKAVYKEQVIAEASNNDLIYIEGNWYFPPSALKTEYFIPNDDRTTCFWKGEASYYDIKVDGTINKSAAWYYPNPLPGAIEKVKKDFSNFVAFWRGVEVVD